MKKLYYIYFIVKILIMIEISHFVCCIEMKDECLGLDYLETDLDHRWRKHFCFGWGGSSEYNTLLGS